ncbi:MAG: D-alanyl-D-alanine carboxypeptidase [Ruminococcaceae bacterium]|nr:D-alanyl-D-alanine carboxypeptidase [Oscillospiraceae bacterium]
MKRYIAFFITVLMILSFNTTVFAENNIKNEAETTFGEDFEVGSFVLMEAETGKVLLSKNPTDSLAPASVTKILTLLIVAEALSDGRIALTDKVTVSATAASLGGSQVFLSEGEVLTVEELIKCTVIASANDAAVALAELIAGSEDAFVAMMNKRAAELGMTSTNFENATGLDDTVTNHVTSALDIAVMSRELIKHDAILKYSSLWQDSIRGGEFVLTNTNRLVRFYDGCTGLKTGSTDKAGFCISTTAKRNGMHLIAVIMGAKTRDSRNEMARKLLDYGFAGYSLCAIPEMTVKEIPVSSGVKEKIMLYSSPAKLLIPKGSRSDIEKVFYLPDAIDAPQNAKESVGRIEYMLAGEKIGESQVYVNEDLEKVTFFGLFSLIFTSIFKA